MADYALAQLALPYRWQATHFPTGLGVSFTFACLLLLLALCCFFFAGTGPSAASAQGRFTWEAPSWGVSARPSGEKIRVRVRVREAKRGKHYM